VITSPGAEGYVVRNIRIIHREGRPDVRQTFTARYRPRPRRISLNPTPVPAVPEPAPPAAEVLPPAAEPTPPTG